MNDTALRPVRIKFDGIQVLRFLAAFCVVVSHGFIFTAQGHPIDAGVVEFFGWVGGWSVNLFFCISGFVIAHSAQGLDSGAFLRHRLLRIYPAYWLAAAVVFGTKWVLFGNPPSSEFSFASLTLLPLGQRPYPLWIEWSLIYEVFFYLLFSLFWTLRSPRFVLICATLWLVAIAAVAFLKPGWASERYPTWDQIAFSTRNIPFIFGIYCYYLRHRLDARVHSLMLLAVPAGIAGIVVFASGDLKTVASAIAAVSLLTLVVERGASTGRSSLLVRLGDTSYGIYLLHISIITILLSLGFKQYGNTWLVLVSVIAVATCVAACFGAVELEMYKRLKRLTDRRGARTAAPALSGQTT